LPLKYKKKEESKRRISLLSSFLLFVRFCRENSPRPAGRRAGAEIPNA